jgi:hypothetical protein
MRFLYLLALVFTFSLSYGDADACLKRSFFIAEALENGKNKLSSQDLDNAEYMLTEMEGHCDKMWGSKAEIQAGAQNAYSVELRLLSLAKERGISIR